MAILEDLGPKTALPTGVMHPYNAYLSRLPTASATTMRGCLDKLAALLTEDDSRRPPKGLGAQVDWWNLTASDVALLRRKITEQDWAPATANKHLSALRQVLQESWRLGLMTTEARDRGQDVEKVTGSRLPMGRSIGSHELDALLDVCSDGTPKGVRDAALIAVLYVTGMRRSELVGLELADWYPVDRTFHVIGKRNKERSVPLSAQALPWLTRWLAVRQWSPGALFCPVRKNGRVAIQHLTPQTVWDVLEARAAAAGVQQPRPHDFRRTVIGDLLDKGTDLATVQKIAGHVSPKTTSAYDRRGDRALLEAVDKLTIRQPEDPE